MHALNTAQDAVRPARTARRLVRALLSLIVAGIAAFGAAELLGLSDLYSFEGGAIVRLVGVGGIAVILVINVALLVLAARIVYRLRDRPPPFRLAGNLILAIGALLALWAAEYLYMEQPITGRLALLVRGNSALALSPADERDLEAFSLMRGLTDADAKQEFRVMYERTRINNPETYGEHPIGATIDKYAARYDVDPATLFFLNYIDSWYGEAASGPVPFLRAMTPETIRDFVQAHLPGWFAENGIRRWLVSSDFLERVAGKGFGFKLRYAFHKATLDVSIAPYALNTYSDIFLVLRQYPEAFPEIFNSTQRDAVTGALFESFQALRNSAVVSPYEQPYTRAPYDAAYYDAHRDDLKRFTRAAFYLTLRDFDFATRVQALLTKYQTDYYAAHLGQSTWAQIPNWQRNAMLVMIRDLYTGNVGRPGYNVYALPELNCTPLEFVALAAASEGGLPAGNSDKLWRPKHYEYLWAGAGYRLRVFSDVWALAYGRGFPGLGVEDTTGDARRVIRTATGH